MRSGLRMGHAAQGEQPQRALACLCGEAVPPEMWNNAQRVGELTPDAAQALWPLIEASLFAPASDLSAKLGRLCQSHELDTSDMARLIAIAVHLLDQAAAIDLPRPQFARDLEVMWPQCPLLRELFDRHYFDATSRLRKKRLMQSLARHGNVLEGIDWQVDRVVADRRSPRLGMPVALVTMQYRHRDRSDELTLQLSSDELRRAARVFEALAEQTERLQPAPASENNDEPA